MNIANAISEFRYTRNFGVEFELYNLTFNNLLRGLRDAGVSAYSENTDYDDDDDDSFVDDDDDNNPGLTAPYSRWKLTYDGSITGTNSIELVSPILSGQNGLREIVKVLEVVNRLGGKVNKSCGFHVHVDADEISAETMRNTYKRYMENEDEIDSFMVSSRRGNNNRYCQSTKMNETIFRSLNPIWSKRTIANVMSRNIDRYNKVNLCAYLRHGTIEFRQHAGTTSAAKAINWVIFCVTMIEVSQTSNDAHIFTGLSDVTIDYFRGRIAELNPNEATSG